MKLVPFDLRVLVRPDVEKTTTESGLFIGRAVSSSYGWRIGTVLAASPTDMLKEGDRIIWKRQCGLVIERDGDTETELLLTRDDILARVESE